jgi:hypothetical protein
MRKSSWMEPAERESAWVRTPEAVVRPWRSAARAVGRAIRKSETLLQVGLCSQRPAETSSVRCRCWPRILPHRYRGEPSRNRTRRGSNAWPCSSAGFCRLHFPGAGCKNRSRLIRCLRHMSVGWAFSRRCGNRRTRRQKHTRIRTTPAESAYPVA